jgi:hypothetical protein
MVDSAIDSMFIDLNSYFASIEQELCPELRGQPILSRVRKFIGRSYSIDILDLRTLIGSTRARCVSAGAR